MAIKFVYLSNELTQQYVVTSPVNARPYNDLWDKDQSGYVWGQSWCSN